MRLATILVLAGVVRTVSAQTLVVEPSVARVDERLTIRVVGMAPGERLMVTASTRDARDESWNAFAGFRADRQGSVDLTRDAPIEGSYSGVRPMGLLYSMTPPPGGPAVRFQTAWDRPVAIVFRLWRDRRETARAEVKLSHLGPGIDVEDSRSEGLVGRLFVPPGNGQHAALLVVGGSEGGLSTSEDAALFASHGFVALALAYFGAEGLPEELAEIPLEYFERALGWLSRHPSVDADRIGIVGTSKGAEAALLLAAEQPALRAVVAYAPTHVSWACICGDDRPSWTRAGEPVPFVSSRLDPAYPAAGVFAIAPVVHYRFRLSEQDVSRARIGVERIAAPVLLISGNDDRMWPSAMMAGEIVQRVTAAGMSEAVHLSYDGAGHFIPKTYLPLAGTDRAAGGRLLLGGGIEATALAGDDSWPRVLRFLDEALRVGGAR